MDTLLAEYRGSLRMVRRAHRIADEEAARQILASMVRDLEWIITYMTTGHPPPVQGYPRTVPSDPQIMAHLVTENVWSTAIRLQGEGAGVREAQRALLDECLSRLTPQERRALLLVEGEMISERQAADIMNLSRSSVRTYLTRARVKIAQFLAEGAGGVDHPAVTEAG